MLKIQGTGEFPHLSLEPLPTASCHLTENENCLQETNIVEISACAHNKNAPAMRATRRVPDATLQKGTA